MALMALDLPALERPTKATSAPTSGGNCAGAAALMRKLAWLKRLIDPQVSLGSLRTAVVYNSAPSPRGNELRIPAMPQTSRLGRLTLVALTALLTPLLSLAQAPAAAAPPAAAQSPTDTFPFTHGKAADGATKAAVCAACHGANGNSTNPLWPRLAGQNAVYIAQQLRLFKSGVRANPVMMPMVSALSDQDIADIAVYFEAQTPLG